MTSKKRILENKTCICLFTIVACVLAAGCGYRQQDANQSPLTGVRAIYLQARNEDKMESDEFGDFWMIEYTTKKVCRLNDDQYYDTSPLWFPDGKSVLFLSNRVGSWSTLKIKGIGAPHEMYRLWLNTRKIERVDEQLSRSYPAIKNGLYESLQFYPDGKSLTFTSNDNVIYRFSLESDSAWPMLNLNNLLGSRREKLWDFSISPDTSLVIMIVEPNEGPLSLRIFRFLDASIKSIPRIDGLPILGGWSPNGEKLLIEGGSSLYEFDTKLDSLKTLITSDSVCFSPNSVFYINEKTITFLGGRNVKREDKMNQNTEILQYDLLEKRLTYLTSDGKYRSSLIVIRP
jgi:hypothetical protein